MKNTNLTRAAASLLACGMVFGLTACSSSASSSEATAEGAEESCRCLCVNLSNT